MTAVVGPVPLFANLPIEPQYYSPWKFPIAAITLGTTTSVQVTLPPILTSINYVVGQQVRLIIPPTFGCTQLNGKTAYVIGIPFDDTVVLNLNSVGGNPYIASSATTPAQIVAVGDVNSGPLNSSISSEGTFIPGSFINISPN